VPWWCSLRWAWRDVPRLKLCNSNLPSGCGFSISVSVCRRPVRHGARTGDLEGPYSWSQILGRGIGPSDATRKPEPDSGTKCRDRTFCAVCDGFTRMPLAFADEALNELLDLAKPIPHADRGQFVADVVALLGTNSEVSPGKIVRVAVPLQLRYFSVPRGTGYAKPLVDGTGRPSCCQARTTSLSVHRSWTDRQQPLSRRAACRFGRRRARARKRG